MRRGLVLVCAWAGWAVCCSSSSIEPRDMIEDLPRAADLDEPSRAQAQTLGASALAAATSGAFAQARDQAGTALLLDPRQPHALAANGVLSMHDAQAESPPTLAAWHRAEGELLRAQTLAPDDPEVVMALARFYAAEGHGRAALDVLERVLLQRPKHAAALRLAGLVAYEASEERRARSYLARLLAEDPEDAESLYRLACCEAVVAERSSDEAVKRAAWRNVAELFQRYRGLVPTDVQGTLGEAQARFRSWQLAGRAANDAELRAALDLYRAGNGLRLDQPESPHGEGVVLEALGDASGAEAAYGEAIRRKATYAPSLLNLAALLAERGTLDNARALWEKALRAGLTPNEKSKVEALLAKR